MIKVIIHACTRPDVKNNSYSYGAIRTIALPVAPVVGDWIWFRSVRGGGIGFYVERRDFFPEGTFNVSFRPRPEISHEDAMAALDGPNFREAPAAQVTR